MRRRSSLLKWSSMDGEERAFLLLRLNDAVLSHLPSIRETTVSALREALSHHAAELGIGDSDLIAAQRQRQETKDIIDWANRMGDSPDQ